MSRITTKFPQSFSVKKTRLTKPVLKRRFVAPEPMTSLMGYQEKEVPWHEGTSSLGEGFKTTEVPPSSLPEQIKLEVKSNFTFNNGKIDYKSHPDFNKLYFRASALRDAISFLGYPLAAAVNPFEVSFEKLTNTEMFQSFLNEDLFLNECLAIEKLFEKISSSDITAQDIDETCVELFLFGELPSDLYNFRFEVFKSAVFFSSKDEFLDIALKFRRLVNRVKLSINALFVFRLFISSADRLSDKYATYTTTAQDRFLIDLRNAVVWLKRLLAELSLRVKTLISDIASFQLKAEKEIADYNGGFKQK